MFEESGGGQTIIEWFLEEFPPFALGLLLAGVVFLLEILLDHLGKWGDVIRGILCAGITVLFFISFGWPGLIILGILVGVHVVFVAILGT